MPSKRISAAAVIAILAFAGFGCRPILDAQNRTQQAAEEKRSQSMWVLQEPELTFRMAPDDTGYAYLDFRTQDGSSVIARLTGPGVVGNDTVTVAAGENGAVHAEWPIKRAGFYAYTAQISFNGVVVETIEGEEETY